MFSSCPFVIFRFGIVVDLISTSEVHISMALSPNVSGEVLGKALKELEKCGTVCFIMHVVTVG